jgi:hypothetical protein
MTCIKTTCAIDDINCNCSLLNKYVACQISLHLKIDEIDIQNQKNYCNFLKYFTTITNLTATTTTVVPSPTNTITNLTTATTVVPTTNTTVVPTNSTTVVPTNTITNLTTATTVVPTNSTTVVPTTSYLQETNHANLTKFLKSGSDTKSLNSKILFVIYIFYFLGKITWF